ncbi:peptidase M56 [Vallitalea longa]|uniref:Peptidase M56 n=1 Tax=Vallitalea longa TaxID=2936439 RepID=A0A9W5Y705_9FIRM|nr:M56 family metallopeptidase [Vallitalea longa]GKX27550.1 peptidase M56 [Vallitalea longa]
MDILNNVFENVLFTTFTSSIITLIILLIRYLLKAKINMKLNQVLLTIIILKFCMVIVPESSISIFNLLPQLNTKNTISESLSTTHESIESQQTPNYSIEKITQTNYNKNLDERLYGANDNVDTIHISVSMKDIISIIWLSGFLIILIGAFTLQGRFNNRLRLCKELDDTFVLNIVDKCKRTLGVKTDVKIYMEDRFKSPFIIGFFAPRIYIPKQLIKLEADDLEHIIMHELAHYKRKDSIYNILSVIAIAINWFNPITWKMSSIIRLDIELACDSYVLDKLGEDKAVSYGRSMLAVARLIIRGNKQFGLACYFGNSKKQLQRRIKMISKFKKNTYKFTAVSLSAALLVGGLVFTNPVKAKTDETQIKYVNDINEKESIVENSNSEYFNVDRLAESIDFRLMLPNDLPDDYKLGMLTYCKADDEVDLFFTNTKGECIYFDINISKTDPTDSLIDKKRNTNPSIIKRKEMSIGGMNGQEIIIDIDSVMLGKHFIFQKDGLYYDISYLYTSSDYRDMGDLPVSEVARMIESLDYVENINIEAYQVPSNKTHVYDLKDMKDARKEFGTDFRLPINKQYSSISYNEKSINFYSSKFDLSIIKEKPAFLYTDTDTSGKIGTGENAREYTKERNFQYINNTKVLKVVRKDKIKEQNTNIKIANKYIYYTWEENDVYYTVTFVSFPSKDINVDMEDAEMEKIVKSVMESKSFDEITKN